MGRRVVLSDCGARVNFRCGLLEESGRCNARDADQVADVFGHATERRKPRSYLEGWASNTDRHGSERCGSLQSLQDRERNGWRDESERPDNRCAVDRWLRRRRPTNSAAPKSNAAKDVPLSRAPDKPRKARVKNPPEPDSADEIAGNTSPNQREQSSELAPTPDAQAQPVPPPSQPSLPPTPPPPPQPRQIDVPANSTLTVRMIDGVDSSVNSAGEIFHASLESPLVVENDVVVPRGADIYVRLVSARSAGRMKGKSELHLELVKMEFQGRSYPLVSNAYSATGSSRGKNTAAKVGGGAALGAIIGALAGGGKGAGIGAGVGAASGAIYQGATKGKQVKIPAETMLDFQLEQPVTVTVMPRPSNSLVGQQ